MADSKHTYRHRPEDVNREPIVDVHKQADGISPIQSKTADEVLHILETAEEDKNLLNASRQRLAQLRTALHLPSGGYMDDEIYELLRIDPVHTLQSLQLNNYQPIENPQSFSSPSKRILTPEEQREEVLGSLAHIIKLWPAKNASLYAQLSTDLLEKVRALKGHAWLKEEAWIGMIVNNPEKVIDDLLLQMKERELGVWEVEALKLACKNNLSILKRVQAKYPKLVDRFIDFSGLEQGYDPVIIALGINEPYAYWNEKDGIVQNHSQTSYASERSFDNYLNFHTHTSIDFKRCVSFLRYFEEHPERMVAERDRIVGQLLLFLRKADPREIPKEIFIFLQQQLSDHTLLEEIHNLSNYFNLTNDEGEYLPPREIIESCVLPDCHIQGMVESMEKAGIHSPGEFFRYESFSDVKPSMLKRIEEWWELHKDDGLTPEEAALSMCAYVQQKENLQVKADGIPDYMKSLALALTFQHEKKYTKLTDALNQLRTNFSPAFKYKDKHLINGILRTTNASSDEIWESIYAHKGQSDDPLFWMRDFQEGINIYQKLFYETPEKVAEYVRTHCVANMSRTKDTIIELLEKLSPYAPALALSLLIEFAEQLSEDKIWLERNMNSCIRICYAPYFYRKSSHPFTHKNHTEGSGWELATSQVQSLNAQKGKYLAQMIAMTDEHRRKKTGVSTLPRRIKIENQSAFADELIGFLTTHGESVFREAANVREQRRRTKTDSVLLEETLKAIKQKMDAETDNDFTWGEKSPVTPYKEKPKEDAEAILQLSHIPSGDNAYLLSGLYAEYNQEHSSHIPLNEDRWSRLFASFSDSDTEEVLSATYLHVQDGSQIALPYGCKLHTESIRSNLPSADIHQNDLREYTVSAGKLEDNDGMISFDIELVAKNKKPGNATVKDLHVAILDAIGSRKKSWWNVFTEKKRNRDSARHSDKTTKQRKRASERSAQNCKEGTQSKDRKGSRVNDKKCRIFVLLRFIYY